MVGGPDWQGSGGPKPLDAWLDPAGLSTVLADAAPTAWTALVGAGAFFADLPGFGDFPESGSLLWLAFGLGLVHAFDADHVMALSVFATGEKSGRRGLRAGLRWSLGHGAMLLAVGLVLFALGRTLPAEVSVLAERAVGALMVALGLYVWADLARQRAHVHFHEHDGLPPHAHWHSHAGDAAHPRPEAHQHEHAASMVGALHGLAGAAPILALLPAASRAPGPDLGSLTISLVIFGLGVAIAMAVVSGALGHLAGRLSRGSQSSLLAWLRAASASGSIAIGLWLAVSA